jgi:hypothetical protein
MLFRVFFGGGGCIGVGTQDLALAKQALPRETCPSPFAFSFFFG